MLRKTKTPWGFSSQCSAGRRAEGKARQYRHASKGFIKDSSFEERPEVRKQFGRVTKPTEEGGRKG